MIIIQDDFLNEDYLAQLEELLVAGKRIHLDSSGPHVMKERTDYDWIMINSGLQKHRLKDQLLDQLEQLTGQPIARENLTPVHLFAKEFDKNSFCAPHKEDPEIYGDWVFMLYLTDEQDGEFTTDSISILPRRNRLLLCRTGFVHAVNHCTGRRLNISGWPYATNEVFERYTRLKHDR